MSFVRPLRLLELALIAVLSTGGSSSTAQAEEPATADNPYLARPKLSRTELAEFIKRMQAKPVSLRSRPGFNEAILDAADRILTGDEHDELATDALLTKLATLHYLADKGDTKADEQLAALADELRPDERPAVAEAVRFYLLERQAIDADAVEAADLPPLLAELKKYCEKQPLDARDLRLASATVRIINRLADDEAAATAYREFGGWFAKSENAVLSRYGRKIAVGVKRPGKGENPLTEKPAAAPPTESDEP
jgi:hypothetical protein